MRREPGCWFRSQPRSFPSSTSRSGSYADEAFEWLDKAVQYHDPGLTDIVADNLFDKIHSDLRWLPFLRKLGVAPDQLAKLQFKVPAVQ